MRPVYERPIWTCALTFGDVVTFLRTTFETFTDRRTGKNTTYTLTDAGLSAFSVFFMQSPSFLEFQRSMQETQGKNNAQTLFGVFEIPTDNQIRSLLDAVEPTAVYPLFDFVFDGLQRSGAIDSFRVADGRLLLALDGTQYFSSAKIHGPAGVNGRHNCLLRQILPSRKRLFDDMKALTTYFCFDSWEHLLTFMLDGWTNAPKSQVIRPPKPEVG
ncbi:MAG: hypothetical protein NTV43_08585 [Methylococcales bacterium]|nr:hypothetical protein [Methylococcales bacterium]